MQVTPGKFSVFKLQRRTNNDVESFNARFMRLVKLKHPNAGRLLVIVCSLKYLLVTLISGTYHLAIRRCRYYTSSGYPISLVLKKMVFPRKTMDLWLRVAAELEAKWDFPHCCGAQDGRNYKVRVSSSLFFISISISLVSL